MATTSLEALAAAMLTAASRASSQAERLVARGAQNVKRDGRRNAIRSATRNAGAPYAITYDLGGQGTSIDAEIGYDKDLPGGALGNILEFGSRNNPPHRDLGRALDTEEPRFVGAFEDLGRVL